MQRTRSKRGVRAAALALALVAGTGLAQAHDFWIVPSVWKAEPGSLVTFDLRIGHPSDSESFERRASHIERFFASRANIHTGHDESAVAHPAIEFEIVGREGAAPAGIARFGEEGRYRVAYSSNPSSLELEAGAFERYLREEGLERIIERRAELGESELPGLESFARCAVTFVEVGDAPEGYGSALGLELELRPLTDPTALQLGESLTLELLREGEPLEGTLVTFEALERAEMRLDQRARTDERGRVTFEVAAPGGWMVAAVDMVRADDELRSRKDDPADWVSHWATFSFTTTPAH